MRGIPESQRFRDEISSILAGRAIPAALAGIILRRFRKLGVVGGMRLEIARARMRPWAVGTLCVLALTGCQQSNYGQRRLAERERGMAYTLNTYIQSERERPQKLERTVTLMGHIIEEDAAQLDYNTRWFGKMIESDVRRFEARQPAYRDVILDLLDGKPENLEHTAIDLFY